MHQSTLRWASLSCLTLIAAVSCGTDAADPGPIQRAGSSSGASAGSGGGQVSAGTTGGGTPGSAGSLTAGGAAQAGEGGATHALGGVGSGGEAGGAGPTYPAECGDPKQQGVVVFQDVTEDTTWSCPVYTLTQPIYVRSEGAERTTLHIEPGVRVQGVRGIEGAKLPGALIVTQTALLDAVGSEDRPIVFTTVEADPVPGDWGGVMMLGRAPTNAPENFEASEKPAGEVYAEALPRSAFSLYGGPRDTGAAGAGGAAGGGEELWDWDCGKLQYVRIEFAGFKALTSKELNGLTIGACGSKTLIDHVQVHRSSDDGIEIFGGSVNISHVVLTGNQDDALDWDQGWRGKAQFVAIQTHDDVDPADSCGVEGDGYTKPPEFAFQPSAPQIWNLTLIASKATTRGARFREGTQVIFGNVVLAAHAQGVSQGLIDIDDAVTADHLKDDTLLVTNGIFRGSWPASGQMDSEGTTFIEEDHFTNGGPSSAGNTKISAASELFLDPFNFGAPTWVPAATSAAAENAAVPKDKDGGDFFDVDAEYRGAFEPGGEDWTSGWTAYP